MRRRLGRSPVRAAPSAVSRCRLFAVLVAFGFIALATLRWDEWVGNATIQITNDAYVRAELTRLSSRVAGEVLDRRGERFSARQGRRSPGSDRSRRLSGPGRRRRRPASPRAQAALDNLANQVELQYATIAQGEAQRASAEAHEVEAARGEGPAGDRCRRPMPARSRSSNRRSRITRARRPTSAPAGPSSPRSVINSKCCPGPRSSARPISMAPRPTLAAAKLKLGYTRIVAPFDGVSRRARRFSRATTSISAATSSTWCRCRTSM